MIILKRWKDSDEWFEADYVASLNLLYLYAFVSEKDTLEVLEQGGTLQTISAWYKKK